ncbi:MAG TPA: PH domain-containing protein [Candidatus Thermoplasmatota archaeon]|nr:PH domain-containing protein [Candidatus Thermoplasmatota archaeon]
MVRLRLMPGERELVRLRPSPGAFLPRYLGGIGLLAWAAIVAYAPGMDPLLHQAKGAPFLLVAGAVPALGGAALYLPRRRMVRLALCLTAATLVVAAPFLLVGVTDRLACAIVLAAAACAAIGLAEADRRMRRYHLTNVRILHHGGLWDRRGWTLHYDTILDLDVRQTPFARLLGHGTIDPVLAAEKPSPLAKPTKRRKVAVPAMKDPILPSIPARMWGVRPLDRVRRLVEAFVTDATATEYLRSEQQTQKRVGQAMHDLGRANLLR